MDKRRSFIIGIGGVTNGGKTTLASSLMKHLPNSTVLNQDDYFWPEDSPKWQEAGLWLDQFQYGHWDRKFDWDRDEAIDFDSIIKDINEWKNKMEKERGDNPKFLIIEGFLLYRQRELCSLLDKKFFLTLPHDVCRTRRMNTVYKPPEPQGYFDAIAWPAYEQFRKDIQDQQDIVYISGTEAKDCVFKRVYEKILNTCKL